MNENQNPNGNMRGSLDPVQAALAIKTARQIDSHLANVRDMTRLALEDNLSDNEELRNQIAQYQQTQLDLLNKVLQQMADLLEHFKDRVATPPVIEVPKTELTLEQQPVTVNVPEAKRPALPSGAKIFHSDGTESRVIFEARNGRASLN